MGLNLRNRSNAGGAGDISPSSTCFQRRNSSVLVSSPNTSNELIHDRPIVLVPSVNNNLPPSIHTNNSSNDEMSTNTDNSALSLSPSSHKSPHNLHRDFFTINSVRSELWSEPSASDFNVRDVGYIEGGKRLKCPSLQSLFRLLTVDVVRCPQPSFDGLCAHPNERIQMALRREEETGLKVLPEFIFAVNLAVPATSTHCNHVVFYFGLDNLSDITDVSTPIGRVAYPFFFGPSDEFRDRTFKLIPRIVSGNFVVRKAVGSKPSILGSKLKQYYVRNERFFELIIDIGSDSIANNIVKVALGYSKTLTVDMMFLLEGHNESMLPERILGGVRIKNLDLKGPDGQRKLE